jgi:hypothetical protein
VLCCAVLPEGSRDPIPRGWHRMDSSTQSVRVQSPVSADGTYTIAARARYASAGPALLDSVHAVSSACVPLLAGLVSTCSGTCEATFDKYYVACLEPQWERFPSVVTSLSGAAPPTLMHA